jgi:diguanylate cyclase (GGDEF)-like protein
MFVCHLSRRLCALLVALLAAGTVGLARAQPGDAPPGAAFDRLFAHLDADDTTFDLTRWRRDTARLKALIPPGDVERGLRHKTLACASDFDDVKAGFAYATQALAEARAARDRDAEVWLMYCQSGYRELFETPQTAFAGYEAGLKLARATGNPRLIAEGLVLRGGVHSLLGDQARALLDFFEAQKLFERAGRPRSAEYNLQGIAVAYRRMGEYDKALEYFEASRARSIRRRDWSSLALDLLQLGFVHESLGEPDRAMAMYREVEHLARRHTWHYDLGAAHLGMAGALVLKREYAQALRMADQAQREFAALGDTSNEGMIALYRGQARAGLGQHAAALAHFDRAARDFEASGNERYLAMLYPERAASLEATGRTREAVEDMKRLLALHGALQRKSGDQRTLVLRHQFEAARRDLDNRRLASEKTARARQVVALGNVRRWQWIALGVGVVLVLVLGALVTRQLRRARRLRTLALTDELTGVANRRSIGLFGEEAFAQARRDDDALTVLTIDIDRFKSVNDTHGHFAGDEVLVRIARACQAALRPSDRLGRMGGEEFLVLLPGTGLDAALPIAERLRQSASALVFDDLASGLRVTLSLGAASLEPGDADLADLLRRADLALYRAKRLGRNRVEADAGTGPSATGVDLSRHADPAEATP